MPAEGVKSTSIVILDVDRLFAEALRTRLQEAGVAVVGIAESVPEGLRILRATPADLALVDARMAIVFGRPEDQALMEQLPASAVFSIVPADRLGSLADADLHLRWLVSKDASSTKAIEAMESALEDLERSGAEHPDESSTLGSGDRLTRREREVLALLADGLSSKAIAEQLGIRPSSESTHVRSILRKLRANSRLEAAALALKAGIVDGRSSGRRGKRSA